MIKTAIFVLVYWMLSLAMLDMLPQIILLAPWLSGILSLHMLQMAGVLIGLLRGEAAGMTVAVISACLLGFSLHPGILGASIASFSVAAWLAGWLTRRVNFRGFYFRWFTIMLLLLIERLVWFSVRHAFWPDTASEQAWLAIIITAFIGSWFYKLTAKYLRQNLITNITI